LAGEAHVSTNPTGAAAAREGTGSLAGLNATVAVS
jgi:hypothetical protein